MGMLVSAINGCGSELEPLSEGCDLKKEHGDVGPAQNVLALCAALILSAQRQQPVLAALYDDNDSRFNVCFACPVPESAPPGRGGPA